MARRGERQVFVELPPPPAEKWRWTSLSPVKVKNEEEDDVIFLGERTLPRQRQRSEEPDEVKVKIEETAEELKFKEQKIKVEPAAIVLSEDSLRRRLDRLPQQVFETELTDEEQMHTITRQLFTDHYEGGHNQFTFFAVRGRALGQRETGMMCPNRVMNPYSPRIPGSHGLFMDAGVADDPESDSDTEEDKKDEKPSTKSEDDAAQPAAETEDSEDKKDVDMKVPRPQPRLALLAHIAPGHWRYVGHYDMFRSEPLTPDEWREQTTQSKWTSVIFREMSCYSMRQRVWHRKQLRSQLKRDPTKEEIREAVEVLSRPELPGLTQYDIELAFERGELRIYIKALCFVKYYEIFQRDLIKISAHPEPRVKARRPKPKPKPKKPEAKPKPKPKSKLKRKRAASDEGEREDEDKELKPKPKRKRADSDEDYVD